MLVPQGSFESGTTGWTLKYASVVSGNEPFYVSSSKDSHSLSIAAGGYASSATACVDISKPILRFFTRSSGGSQTSLKVEVLYEDWAGKVHSASVASVAPGPWAPTAKMQVTVSLLPLLSNNRSPVQFRFTPIGSAGWQIDDVYVDPYRSY
jgi:hypothetical protein